MNQQKFQKQMNNLIQYSLGFLDGAQSGKTIFLNNLGQGLIKALYQYIDTEAKVNPNLMHHVYEWYRTGSPTARLYDLNYSASKGGLMITTTFKQSKTVAKNSRQPFYNKANIMERGIPVTIKPKRAKVLAFTVDGEEVFTSKPITVNDPGGKDVQGSFAKVFNNFMRVYFKQSFLKSSGIYSQIKKPTLYKTNLKGGINGGKSKGIETGYQWMANIKIGVE